MNDDSANLTTGSFAPGADRKTTQDVESLTGELPAASLSIAQRYRWHVVIFLLAMVVRGVYFYQFLNSPLEGELRTDHAYYFQWAKEIYGGDWLGHDVFEMSPLYPYLLAGVMHVIGVKLNWLMLVQLLVGAGYCVLVYACATRLFDKMTAILAGIVHAIYGPQIFYECMIMKEFLSPVATIVALYAALRYSEGPKRVRWLCAIGIAIGLSCLVRENHVLMLGPLGLWIWTSPGTFQLPVRTRLLHLVGLGMVAFACLIPTAIRNYQVAGEMVLVTTGGGEVFYMGHGPYAQPYYQWPPFVTPNPFKEHEDFRREAARRAGRTMTRSESSSFWYQEGWREIANDPGRTAVLTGKKALYLFNDYEVPDSESYRVSRLFLPVLRYLPSFGWISALGFLGIIRCFGNLRRYQLVLGLAAAHAVSVLILYNFGRFRIGMMPTWILLASFGLTWFFQRARQEGLWHWIKYGSAIVLVAVLTFISFRAPLGRIPLSHQIHDAGVAYGLAIKARALPLAEQQLRTVVRLYNETDLTMEVNADPLAWNHMQLGKLASQTSPNPEATSQFREALKHAKGTSMKRQVQLAWVDYLIRTITTESKSAGVEDPRHELSNALRQLRETAPNVVSYWSLSALYADSEEELNGIAVGLESAWEQTDQSSKSEEGWHLLGQAAIARTKGDAATAAEKAQQAMIAWPDHPFRNQLKRIADRDRLPR